MYIRIYIYIYIYTDLPGSHPALELPTAYFIDLQSMAGHNSAYYQMAIGRHSYFYIVSFVV